MKELLRRKITERQYDAMARVKSWILSAVGYWLVQAPFLLLGLMIKLFPARSRISLKSRINVVKKMDYRRRNVFITLDSDFEYRVRLNSCQKEPETVEWIETLLSEGDVLYDIGANIGAYSLVASKFFAGKVKVYAFEPAFLNFTQLCKNLVLNECQGSIVPLQLALSDQTGLEVFNFRSLVPGSAVHALGEPVDHTGNTFRPAHQQTVLSYRGDDLIDQFQLPVPNHMKIDVDGIEFSILKGLDTTLTNPSLRSIMLELNEGRGLVNEVQDFLHKKGFKVQAKHGANNLFVRSS